MRVPQPSEDLVRVPTADETAATLARARHALTEIKHREAADAARSAEELRLTQLAHWRSDDGTTRAANQERPLERTA
jgi:hypothetical protein